MMGASICTVVAMPASAGRNSCNVYACDLVAFYEIKIGGGNMTNVLRICHVHARELQEDLNEAVK